MTIRESLKKEGICIPRRNTFIIPSRPDKLAKLIAASNKNGGMYQKSQQFNSAKAELERLGL